MIAKITIRGTKWKMLRIVPLANIVQAKPAKILRRQWPDIILANNRRDKLTTLKL